jgi:radical SAM protein with 4Fe4S-binding SPASM domain
MHQEDTIMKAKDITGSSPGGQRTPLGDVIPLQTPYIVQIFPIYACNFRCNYCIFSVPKNERHFISDKKLMELSLLQKAVDEMVQFNEKIKVLRFVGIGEPILHKQISQMIKYSVDKNIANKVELLTNAATLDKKLSDSLIDAKLDRLVISLQGVNSNQYKKIADVDIDFDSFINNIRYFYENKTNTEVYIKIVDQALESKSDKNEFYKIFGDICDTLAIENLVPIHEVEYEENISGVQQTQFGQPLENMKICPQPFYTMQLNPDGNVVPCYSFKYPIIVGNVYDESIYDIWYGGKFNKFRYEMANKGMDNINETCAHCTISKFRIFKEDLLDKYKEKIKAEFAQ